MAGPLHKYLKRRTEARFERLLRSTYEYVLHAADRVLSDRAAAEDVAQDVYLGLLRSPPESEHVRSDIGWLCARSIGLARTRQRSTTRRSMREERTGESGMDHHFSTDDAYAVQQAVDALPDPQRQCVELAYFGQLPTREIATLLDVTPRAVDKRLKNARSALERSLTPSLLSTVSFGPMPRVHGVRGRTQSLPNEETVQQLLAQARKESLLEVSSAPSLPLVAATVGVACVLAAGVALWSPGTNSTSSVPSADERTAVLSGTSGKDTQPTLLGAAADGTPSTASSSSKEQSASTRRDTYSANVQVVDDAGELVRTGSVRLQPAGIEQQLRLMKLAFDPELKRFAWLMEEISLSEKNPIRIENVPAALIGLEVDVLAVVPGYAQAKPLRLRVEAGASLRLQLPLRKTVTLGVSVVDRQTRSPVAGAFVASKTEAARRGATVRANGLVGALQDELDARDESLNIRWSGRTDASGACTLSQLYPGPHSVTVQRLGYHPATTLPQDTDTPITVELQPIARPANVRVHLVSADGSPVSGIPIEAQQANATYTLVTNDEGQADFHGLLPGFSAISVDATAWAERMGKRASSANIYHVLTLAPDAEVEVRLGHVRGRGVLSLSLRRTSGAPIVGVPVRAYGEGDGEASTDENGDVLLRELPVGTYRVQVGTLGEEWSLRNVAVTEAGVRREIVVSSTSPTLTISNPSALSTSRPKRGYMFLKGAASTYGRWKGEHSMALPSLPVGHYTVEIGEQGVSIGRGEFEIKMAASSPVEVVLLRGASIRVATLHAELGVKFSLKGADGATLDLTRKPGALAVWAAASVFPGRYELTHTGADGATRTTILDLRDAEEIRVDLDNPQRTWR